MQPGALPLKVAGRAPDVAGCAPRFATVHVAIGTWALTGLRAAYVLALGTM